MSITITSVLVNNKQTDAFSPINVRFSVPIINWSIETTKTSIRQSKFEIRIGTHAIQLGTDHYYADVRELVSNTETNQFRLGNRFINRGETYYGQIKVTDSSGEESDWSTFAFTINRLIFVVNASISPSQPSENDDLILNYTLSNSNGRAYVKWFKNGIHYRQFDNYTKISHEYLRYKDTWYAEIIPYDDLENGSVFPVSAVFIQKLVPQASNLEILPKNANANDILEASYSVIDANLNAILLNDKSKIRWYVNDILISEANDSKFIRFQFKPNDVVYFTLTPSDGLFDGDTLASSSITILDTGFRVSGLKVDGVSENINIKSVNPTVEWTVIEPYNRISRFAKIQIGSVPGSNNIYETVIETFDEQFTIPDNIIKRGIDYYITVYASDTQDDFANPSTAHFRVSGSLWEQNVNNSTGWAIEVSLKVSGEGYQRLSIGDGKRYAEIRFYENRIDALFGESNIKTYDVDMTLYKNIIISAKGNNLKVFVSNVLSIDGSSLFIQESSEKFIEVGSKSDSDSIGYIKRINYYVDGDFDPTESNKYSDITVQPFISFIESSISCVTEHAGDVLVATNPRNPNNSSKIYKLIETQKPITAATESLDHSKIYLNRISSSTDEKYTWFMHNKGASFFQNYLISNFSVDSTFSGGYIPEMDNWQLVSTTPFDAVSYKNEGISIDTTFSNTSRIDSRLAYSTQNIPAIEIEFLWSESVFTSQQVTITISSSDITINSTGSLASGTLVISKSGKTVQEICDTINEYEIGLINSLIKASPINDTNFQSASLLSTIVSDALIFPSYTIRGNYKSIDPYNPNPYSYTAGGKCFYSHRKPGTPWFDQISSSRGYTIDFNLTVESVEDIDFPSNTDNPEGLGIYFNDGSFYESIYFLPQEIVFSQSNKSFLYDTTTSNNYRITGKDGKINLWAKNPSTPEYEHVAEVVLQTQGSNAGNASRPAVCSDASGKLYATWHDDGNNHKRQIYFAEFTPNIGWSDPELVVIDNFGANNPDIAIDSLGIVYIVFETQQSDKTDIAVVHRNEIGWSDPYILTSNVGDSLRPRIAIDGRNNVHVVWEDYRLVDPQIFYCRRNASDGQWESSYFGKSDIQISLSPQGAKFPCIAAYSNNVYIAWTALNSDGTSNINLAYGSSSSKTFDCSGQGGVDFLVSSINSYRADASDILVDIKGQVVVVWNDIVNSNYQIFSRFISPRLSHAQNPVQITSGVFDSKFPKMSLDIVTGNIYVVFEKLQDELFSISDPYDSYDPYAVLTAGFKSNPSICLNRWNSSLQIWESSNITTNRSNTIYGGYDVFIYAGDGRSSRRPIVPNSFSQGNLHIIHEVDIVSRSGENLENQSSFTQIHDIIFDGTYSEIYEVGIVQYAENDFAISNNTLRKEIRFGDFSNTVGSRFAIGYIKYYTHDAVEPFLIRLISSATTNISSAPINCSISNVKGDAWLGTDNGLLFYNKEQNSIFHMNSSEFGINNIKIKDIAVDHLHNMWLASDSGLYFSPDHMYFWKITGISNATSLAIDQKHNVYVGTISGLYTFKITENLSLLAPNKENYNSERTIEVPDIKIYDVNSGMPSNHVNVVKTDFNEVAWIGTNNGLVRFFNGSISTFGIRNGMSSLKVNDIAIRNTGIRYLATSAGVDKMIGVGIEKLDFDNINSPISSSSVVESGDVKIPKFNNVKSVLWKDPNILFIAAGYEIYQIIFSDELFVAEKPQIAKFVPGDYVLIDLKPSRNDDLQSYSLVGLDDITLSDSCIFEVYLNGNPIIHGFTFSPKNKIIRFDYPLLQSDIVQVIIRPDIEMVNDFTQDKAAQIAVGTKSTIIEKLLSVNGHIYAQTGGDINSLQVNDETSDKPFDKIILDTVPPVGKINIKKQIDQSHVLVEIDQIESGGEYLPFDATSGIDKMVVSNYTNFTENGEEIKTPIPFATSLIHDLGTIFDNVTRQYTIPAGKGRRLALYTIGGSGNTIAATMKLGTSSPAAIYSLDSITQKWEFASYLGQSDNQDNVNFMVQFNGSLVVGTGKDGGIGQIFVSKDGNSFGSSLTVDGENAYCAVELNGILYIGSGGGSHGGQVYSFDGSNFNLVFNNISGYVYGLTAVNGELYASTGHEGRIYRLDPLNLTQQIVHVDYESDQISIASGTVNSKTYVFVGGSTNATIKRSLLPDRPFVHSFKTVSNPVYSLKNINSIVYACIGDTLYKLDGVWSSKYTHSEHIKDVSNGPGNIVWFVSDNYVYKIEDISIVRKVYLKLIDKAGNETSLFTDSSQTVLNTNLYDSISLDQLTGFTNSNRILEVNEYGDTVYRIDGNDKFYSADKIDEETGTYYSEIFNGTNSFVAWDKLIWDATIPDNTGLTFYIRTGATRDEVLNNEFLTSFNGSEQRSADISFLSGQHLQVKVVMTSKVRGMSPSLRKLTVKSIAGESVHFFTTNFVLPSRVKSGLITSHSKPFIPVSADVIFGINTNNSVDFSDYQIIDENRVFTTDNTQVGSNLRIGIRLLTPTKGESISESFGEYGPYSSPLFFNSVQWNYANSGTESLFNFKVSFYENIDMQNSIYEASSLDSTSGFSFDGELLSSTGALIGEGVSGSLSFTPPTDAPLICNNYYYVKIEVIDSESNITTISDSHSFVQACGVSYVDVIDFDFTNTSLLSNFHFRVRFYDNQERTNLVYTAFSGNDTNGWEINGDIIPPDGYPISGATTVSVIFQPDLSNFNENTIYYLSIDAFDGSQFIMNSNSFTFKAKNIASGIYCGEYSDVPVVKNFGVIFELDDGQMVTLQLDN